MPVLFVYRIDQRLRAQRDVQKQGKIWAQHECRKNLIEKFANEKKELISYFRLLPLCNRSSINNSIIPNGTFAIQQEIVVFKLLNCAGCTRNETKSSRSKVENCAVAVAQKLFFFLQSGFFSIEYRCLHKKLKKNIFLSNVWSKKQRLNHIIAFAY